MTKASELLKSIDITEKADDSEFSKYNSQLSDHLKKAKFHSQQYAKTASKGDDGENPTAMRHNRLSRWHGETAEKLQRLVDIYKHGRTHF